MRISDWSSDVCSSDLNRRCGREHGAVVHIELAPQRIGDDPARFLDEDHAGRDIPGADALFPIGIETAAGDIGHIDRARAEPPDRSEEHTSELQSLMRISYAVFCLTTTKGISTYIGTTME